MINKLYKYKYGYRYNMALDATKGREIQQNISFLYFSEAYTFYFRSCDKKTITTKKKILNNETLYKAIERDCIILANIAKPSLHINNSQ